jgi:hypothetical protein
MELPKAVTTCARCGAPFVCGRDGPEACWCAGLPPLDPARYDAGAGCLCEACLRMLVNAPRS